MMTAAFEYNFAGRILDDSVLALEEALCQVTRARHAVAVSRVSSGLVLALRAAGVVAGDRVVLPALAEQEVLEAVGALSATPLFADINPNTFLLDPFCLEYVIGRCIRARETPPKALICSNLFGMPCAYNSIEAICRNHGIALIEDASRSLGAGIGSRRSGTFGRFSVISLLGEGNLALGEDGAVLCHTPADAAALRRLRDGFARQLRLAGMGGSSGLVTALLAQGKLLGSPREQGHRARVVALYAASLRAPARLQQAPESAKSAWNQLAILLPDSDTRSAAIHALAEGRIPHQIPFAAPLHRLPSADGGRTILVNAQSVCGRLLTLPLHPYLTPGVIRHICDCVNSVCERVPVKAAESVLASVSS